MLERGIVIQGKEDTVRSQTWPSRSSGPSRGLKGTTDNNTGQPVVRPEGRRRLHCGSTGHDTYWIVQWGNSRPPQEAWAIYSGPGGSLESTVLGQRLCSLRVASVGPSGYPTGRLQGLLPMAVVTWYPVDIWGETGDQEKLIQITRAKQQRPEVNIRSLPRSEEPRVREHEQDQQIEQISAGGGHSLPVFSCTSGEGPPLLDGYLLRVQGQDGVSGSKGPQPVQSSLHVRGLQSFLFSSQLPSPALSFHSTNLKVAEMGLVRTPASRCRSQGPEDLGNWHRVECLWWFLLVK